jgi:hypothetical protein
MSFDILFPVPTGCRTSDDMGLPDTTRLLEIVSRREFLAEHLPKCLSCGSPQVQLIQYISSSPAR